MGMSPDSRSRDVFNQLLEEVRSGRLTMSELQERLNGLGPQKLPLSEGQRGLLVAYKFAMSSSGYNLPMAFRIKGAIDIEIMKEALRSLLERFPILKSVIESDGAIPYQLVKQQMPLKFASEDLSHLAWPQVISHLKKRAKKPFVLEEGPLLRAELFSLKKGEAILLITVHHIIFDGSSMLTLSHALFEAYGALLQGQKPAYIPSTTSYADFVLWQQDYLESERGEGDLAYWKEKLVAPLPILELPTDFARPSEPSYKGETHSRGLSKELSEQLRRLARSLNVNLSILFLAGFKAVLSRYTNQEEIVVGMPTRGRPDSRFDSTIGYFINMVALRSKIEKESSFSDFLKELQLTVADALDHADYPLSALVRALPIERTRSASPLFQAAFLFQNFFQSNPLSKTAESLPALQIQLMEEIRQEGEFELALEVYEKGDQLQLNLSYCPELFLASTIEQMMGQIIRLLEEAERDPSLKIESYPLMTQDEQAHLLKLGQGSDELLATRCIHEIFEERVLQIPEEIAVIYEEKTLSYRELDDRANLLARYLQQQGVGPEILVGICVERSLEMVIGILGILKAGGAYLPLDPTHPGQQLKQLIEDSEIHLLLTQAKFSSLLASLCEQSEKLSILCLDSEKLEQEARETKALKKQVLPSHLAYMIYTSGSTGKPKGVMVEHRSIVNTLSFLEKQFPVGKGDSYLLKTHYIFDVSLSELFGWFFGKGHLVILPPGAEKSPHTLASCIEKQRITHINFVPSLLNVFLNAVEARVDFGGRSSIKYLMVAGEAFPKALVRRAVQFFKHSRVENIYGPTESAIYATWFSCSEQALNDCPSIPIGRPIAKTELYILDRYLSPVAIGMPGELYIGGEGLARGYWKNPELTRKKFIDNPFRAGKKLFKSGDGARWLANGQVEYLGRLDYQVKIRGFRIELGAIDNQVGELPGVRQCVTIVKEHEEHKKLVTYYVPSDLENPPSSQKLRRDLLAHLPDYMVPAHLIQLSHLPLTPNGKVDRKELERREISAAKEQQRSASSSKVEQQLLDIWHNLLKVKGIGSDDGFFDVGGDSLLAATAIERINEVFRCDLTVTDLFAYPTIRSMAGYLVHQRESELPELPRTAAPSKREEPALSDLDDNSVAIIGISCHFPGSKNALDFYKQLLAGKESVQFFSKEELRALGVPESLIHNPNYVPVRSSIEGKDLFDPEFFHISPKDAEMMDPQLRLLLLHAWKAVEDAGYISKQIADTSVYMSASNNGYQTLLSSELLESADGYVSWVLSQSGTIPTMISHKLGLKGPSYFVHANCSSSLVGLYAAYQSLKLGQAKQALVGATTLHVSPSIGYVHQSGLNFSSDGHIKAFDAKADGMIAGEGVAVILLKRASDAVREGDHIYALLRAIEINNDGAEKAGFYAPSVKGQSLVIKRALENAEIHPESICYVEAHGTGTALGDPIEIAALTEAYRSKTSGKQYCGIGSVKSNIGHLDTAAGLAGCIKVAMSLCYQELAPSINCKEPNPLLDLENSPFYVVEKRTPLEQKRPLRAALSSFGLGGTNVHAIFEDYRAVADKESFSPPYLIPLSAKSEERLLAYAEELLRFLDSPEWDERNIAHLAYTFQVGREAMACRILFIAESSVHFKSELKAFTSGNLRRAFKGTASLERTLLESELVSSLLSKGKFSELATLWSKGLDIDWEKIYGENRPRRMSLPTYPFAEKKYWPEPKELGKAGDLLHPMVHKNSSTLSEQRYSSLFTGGEFFIAEHIILGEAIVPAVVTLEMALAAFREATGENEHAHVRLKNIIWIRPIVVDKPMEVQIALHPQENGQIAYQISSRQKGASEELLICTQGAADLVEIDQEESTLKIGAIKERCSTKKMGSKEFYEAMVGASYGPRYRSVKELYLGEREVLAQLELPDLVQTTKEFYALHPSLLDGALQAAEYLQNVIRARSLSQQGKAFQAALPFALEEMVVKEACSGQMWVHAIFSDELQENKEIQKVDILLSDESGTIAIQIKGFSIRTVSEKLETSETQKKLLALEPLWKAQAIDSTLAEAAADLRYQIHSAFLLEMQAIPSCDGIDISVLDERSAPIEQRFQSYASQILKKIQNLLASRPEGLVLLQVVVPSSGEGNLFSSLAGLLKTAALENSKFIGQMIEMERSEKRLLERLQENKNRLEDVHIRYEDNDRYVLGWRELACTQLDRSLPWKDKGVYLITGGTGGLGLIFAKEIAKWVKDVSIILVARSELTGPKELELASIRKLGASVDYLQVDLAHKDEVEGLIKLIHEIHGHLDGIIHAAGVIRDSYIVSKTVGELREVFAPKVASLINLDEASSNLDLDFMILFSSAAAITGSQGQADYSAANGFMDSYAGYRNQQMELKRRKGRTLVINWPLWKEGGMQVDAATQKMVQQNSGMSAMESAIGLEAFYAAWHHPGQQFWALYGDPETLRKKVLSPPRRASKKISPSKAAPVESEEIIDKLKTALRHEIVQLLKVRFEDIDDRTLLAQYGLDSISMVDFINRLNQKYKLELTPTLFFEYPTVQELASHLVTEYWELIALHFDRAHSPEGAFEKPREELSLSKKDRFASGFIHRPNMVGSPNSYEPIAIIGISGLFPMARDVEAFWKNLEEGRDCISEIPKDRWDWREYERETQIRWGGFIEGIAEFDPLFFGISPREAERMDPGQRLLMTLVWQALENAGYSGATLSGTSTGLFLGTANTGYSARIAFLEGSSAANMTPSAGPNRISYFLNIHGPSEPIDTACSSSLVALHHAVGTLHDGSCEMALAGGINTILLPDVYIAFDKAGALSKEGRCKAFSNRADGFVHGEGAGILVLKKLSAAIRDGDAIWAVIRGSAVNHGGHASTPTTPSPKAQADLVVSAYKKAGIDPRSVTYIETHGTGTELGDPIEINGLKSAFKQLYSDFSGSDIGQFRCGLGSVKSNIGHLSLAAGVAGIIKVLLQLKHRKLVKSLHCETINPYIQLEKSPFYIVQENQIWEAVKDGRGRELPRRAGISSFGIGGVNAHVVIEEYIAERGDGLPPRPSLIVLSARNGEQLKERMENLLLAIKQGRYNESDLVDIAFTLQVGRDAMQERVGFVASSLNELTDTLEQLIQGRESKGEIYKSSIDLGSRSKWMEDEEITAAIAKWSAKRKYGRILDFWVKGLPIDWAGLYDKRPKKIALPGYPFAKDRYWIGKSSALPSGYSPPGPFLHPLLHQNSSDLEKQCFTSTFTGEEFFLKEHVIRGQSVLPGVAHLEMARVALERSLGGSMKRRLVRLKKIVWVQPIVFKNDALKIEIGLAAEEDGDIAYEIYSHSSENEKGIVYSQGGGRVDTLDRVPKIDLAALQKRCEPADFSIAEVYETYRAIGFDYGPQFSGISAIYLGKNLVLAKLSLPRSILDDSSPYTLHPGVMDSALQCSSLLVGTHGNRLMLPFAIDEVEIYGRCRSEMWACATLEEDEKGEGAIHKRHIDLFDDEGNLCVRLKGLTFRLMEASPEAVNLLLLKPVWKAQEVEKRELASSFREEWIILCEMDKAALTHNQEILVLDERPKRLDNRFTSYAGQIFKKLQSLLKAHPEQPVLIQIVVPSRGEGQLFAAFSALLKTVSLENSKVTGQILEIDPEEHQEGIFEKLRENRAEGSCSIRYREGRRYLSTLEEQPSQATSSALPWKDRGCYLITGGLGGLGLIFAKEIAAQCKNPSLILIGRSPLAAQGSDTLSSLRSLGVEIDYHAVDVADNKAVHDLIANIQHSQGHLNGILHAAGVIEDNYLINKSESEFERVFSPKVRGLSNLDEATQGMELDFIILFSSLAAAVGSPGQVDYATANAFMDRYACYRNELLKSGQRSGKTLSINWPLWKEGGMRIDASTEKMLMQNTGIVAVDSRTALRAFYQSFGHPSDQTLVIQGNVALLREKFSPKAPPSTLRKNPEQTGSSEIISSALKNEISKLLKINIKDIEPEKELQQYGFDSITFTELTGSLNEKYKLKLTPTLFFEYPTLRRLTSYFEREHPNLWLSPSAGIKQEGLAPPETGDPNPEIVKPQKSGRFLKSHSMREPIAPSYEPVAIVGVSGVFPMAQDIDQFWKNLERGQDCITLIPEERWDFRAYYGDEANKTRAKWGGFVESATEFDPLFFGISPREAELMDPQQRLLMTHVWKALEDAGYSSKTLSGSRTGLFIGTGSTGYSALLARAGREIEGTTAANMSPSIGPNRVSYYLNIRGPSEPIDTACSSSLVAIHHALSALYDGSCEMAIAGGVNTLVVPEGHIAYDKAGALSKEGRCKTFSAHADGFVPGEGSGILILKKLNAAVRDRDHIWGLISSSSVNHGGHASSLTAPSPTAQADLIASGYKKFGIDPRTISYIEAHGTGTELGDPVEINGLKSAFIELYSHFPHSNVTTPRCGLGSVKSNIGHLSLAAGVAGVIKVLLQLKHKTLVKSLHCDTINPYIQLENSPFYIVRKNQSWETPRDSLGRELPRRAAVSSFGIGGVNAHLVIEEYLPQDGQRAQRAAYPAIILLSARNEEQLKARAEQLLSALKERRYREEDLDDIAYTLQIGRDPMAYRAGFIVSTIGELKERLEQFVRQEESSGEIYKGKVDRASLAPLIEDEEIREATLKWMERGKYSRLLELWTRGLDIDWMQLYRGPLPKRISLPSYPFAKERYWPRVETDRSAHAPSNSRALHPLLHQNISDFFEQRFLSNFSGEEFFLRDHRVQGKALLPAVCYLEMAREAALQAMRGSTKMCIRNVGWLRPFSVQSPTTEMALSLALQKDDEVSFEIYQKAEEKPIVYCQGRIAFAPLEQENPLLDLDRLSGRCNRDRLSSQRCYELFHSLGIDYGPAHQAIKEIYIGEGEALAKLELPRFLSDTIDLFILHPSLLDSALQAAIGLKLKDNRSGLSLPFALDEIEIFERCKKEMWAWVRKSEKTQEGERIERLDIDLCDVEGHLSARLKGISSRVVKEDPPQDAHQSNLALLVPLWDITQLPVDEEVATDPFLVLGEDRAEFKAIARYEFLDTHASDSLERKLEAREPIGHILYAPSQNDSALELFRIVKALLSTGYGTRELSWTIATEQAQNCGHGHPVNAAHAAIHGLAGSLAKEYPNWRIRLVDLESGQPWPLRQILSLPFDPQGDTYTYRNREWHKLKLIPLRYRTPDRSLYRKGGVYVIIGGGGGIGEAWSEYMIRTYQAHLIWIGRKGKDSAIESRCERLATLGPKPIYIQADATDLEALKKAYETVKIDFPEIHGVVHSALVLKDQSLANMDEASFNEVLRSKVDISLHMAQVFSEEKLDFVLFFSSMQSFARAAGQGNYAAGSTFEDGFAAWLARQKSWAVKVMNWGYWGSIGVVSSERYRQRMAAAGIGSIEPEEAMQALEFLLTSPFNQLAMIKTLSENRSLKSALDELIEVYPEKMASNLEKLLLTKEFL